MGNHSLGSVAADASPAAKGHITLAEIQARLAERGIEAGCLTTIWSTLRRLGLSYNKTASGQPSRTGRMWPNAAVCGACGSASWTRSASCSSTRPAPARTWCAGIAGLSRSEHLVTAAPHGHWRTTTFVAGLRSTGLVAPLVLDGPMNGAAFLAYVEHFLTPTLKPGDVVVMDALAAHKVASIAEAIRAVGASVLYLPPYSPDLNPIEQAFSKLKALLRAAAARTKETLWTTIGQLLHRFSPDECCNCLANSGCEFT